MVKEGVPDLTTSEIYAYVIELASSLEVTVFKRDIANFTRIPRRSVAAGDRPKPGPIVFVHAHLSDRILGKKTDLKAVAPISPVRA